MIKMGRDGKYGGQYVSETLMSALIELKSAYERMKKDPGFVRELAALQKEYTGCEMPLTFGPNASQELGCRIYLKWDDEMGRQGSAGSASHSVSEISRAGSLSTRGLSTR